MDFQVVVLAGGTSKNLVPLVSKEVPKALLPVANRPVLSYVLDLLEQTNLKDLIIVVEGEDAALLVGGWISGSYVDRLHVEIHTKKRNRLEHQRLNALVYVKYNLKLSKRSIWRRDKIDPIIVDEVQSDDEWITAREDPVLPKDTSWLYDDELFSRDPIVSLPPEIVDSALENEVPIIDVDSSPTSNKRKVGECSSGGKGKEMRLDPVDEDVEIDILEGVAPRIFDSARFPYINTLDQYDDDIILDDADYF